MLRLQDYKQTAKYRYGLCCTLNASVWVLGSNSTFYFNLSRTTPTTDLFASTESYDLSAAGTSNILLTWFLQQVQFTAFSSSL